MTARETRVDIMRDASGNDAPPEHPDGTVHETKEEADAAEAAEG